MDLIAMVPAMLLAVLASGYVMRTPVCAPLRLRHGAVQARLDGGAPDMLEAGKMREAERIERALRLTALQAGREEVPRLARTAGMSDKTAPRLVRETDLLESRYH